MHEPDSSSSAAASGELLAADVARTTVAAIRDLLHESHVEWRAIVHGLEPDTLDWSPGPETNSITVLTAHALDAERAICALASGLVLPRDREAAFRVRGETEADLLHLIDTTEVTVDGYLARIGPAELVALMTRRDQVRSGATWLVRATQHLREHLGQAALTRQLAERRAAAERPGTDDRP